MSKRIPVDIQFLMESVLSEDPDTMSIRQSDVEMLNDKGGQVSYGHYSWDQTAGAVPFYIDVENNVVVFAKMNTHGRMERALRKTSLISIDPIMFKHDCVEKTYMNCAGIYVKSVDIPITIYFYGISKNNIEGIREYLKENRDKLKSLEIRGYGEDANELCGRMWVNNNAISFWNKKDKIKPIFNLVFKFMKNCGLNPAKCAYEFLDSKNIYGYSELGADVDEKDKLTPEEMHAKLEKQHLNKSKKDYGPEFWERHKEKAAKGFDIAAKADASVPALEQHVKLKDLIR